MVLLIGLFTGSPAAAQQMFIGQIPGRCRCVCEHPAPQPRTTNRPVAEAPVDGGLVVEIHEDLLNRIVRRTEQRQSPVRDFVLGADVHGMETTTTTIQVDVRPSNEGVAVDMVLLGRNRSHTVGYTPQAAVRTLGQHQFRASKFVVHDGRLFHTQRPRVDVAPSNQTLGVETPVSGVPVLGDVASSIGYQAAESQRAQGEMIAARKIRDGVGTEFNRQIDTQLAQLNRGWANQVTPRLAAYGFGDLQIAARSTDEWARYMVELPAASRDDLRVPQRVRRPSDEPKSREGESPAEPQRRGPVLPAAADARPAPVKVAERTVPVRQAARRQMVEDGEAPLVGRIAVSDAFINGVLARLRLNGAEFRAAEFARPATVALAVLEHLRRFGVEIAEIPPEAAAALLSLVIRFDEHEPLRVAFTPDVIWIRARAAVAVPPLIDLPMLQITLRYRTETAANGDLSLVPLGLELKPADADGPALGPLALLLESQATTALPAITLPRTIRIPLPGADPLQIDVDALRVEAGRVSVTIR